MVVQFFLDKRQTRRLLLEFLNGLGFEDPEKKFELQRVHRLGKLVSGPIVARFLRYQDHEMVLRASFTFETLMLES